MDRHTEYRDDDGLRVPYRACDAVGEGCKAPPALAGSFTKWMTMTTVSSSYQYPTTTNTTPSKTVAGDSVA